MATPEPMDFLERLDRDGTVQFFLRVQACMIELDAKNVSDFGAGRGGGLAYALERKQCFKAGVQNLASQGAHVTACDIDPAVLDHPTADDKIVSPLGQALPFRDGQFDMIVTDNTFEHVANPDQVASELLRILRPGGVICARTPSKYGYVALISHLIPSRKHSSMLRHIQPEREEQDVFPTCYLLNTHGRVSRHFAGADVVTIYQSGEPSYYFGSTIVKALMSLLHKVLVGGLNTNAWFFIRKHTSA